jgi:tetratricopeptide (TPR) repeat protein
MKYLFFLLWISASYISNAQSTTKQHYLDVYKRGIKYNDSRTAITALQGYLALGEDLPYKDTLAMIYYLSGEYYPSLLLSQEVMTADKSNVGALERVAGCYTQLGDLKKSVEHYEKLCPVTKNPFHYYQLAQSQYQLKRVAECTQNLQLVIADTSSKKVGTQFSVGQGQAQNVSLTAAAYNMIGVIEMEAKNYDNASKLFTKALEEFPDFVGAYQNIEQLKKLKGTKAVGTKPKTNKKG